MINPLLRCAGRLLDLFFEKLECPVCRAESKGLCAGCRSLLQPWGSFVHEGIPGAAVLHYSGAAKKLIYAYKKRLSFAALDALEGVLDDWLAQHELSGFDVIVPVPSIAANIRARGFDPGLLLARHLSRKSGIPLLNCVENRGRQESKQKSLRQRREAASGRFRINERQGQALQGKRVLVFDDVMTSGATIRAVTGEVRRYGAAQVEFLALARATAS